MSNPMYCMKCGQFGQTQKVCPVEKQRCLKCGEDDHETENCKNEHECVNCFKAHDLNPRSCEIYKLDQKCIRYASKAQISVAQVRRYAAEQIYEFVKESAEEHTMAQLLMEEKGGTGEKVIPSIIRTLYGDEHEDFNFHHYGEPEQSEGMPCPSQFVNVLITEVGVISKVPTTYIQEKILANVLGFSPSGTLNEGSKSFRLKFSATEDVDKLINTKEVVLDNINYKIEADPEKKINQQGCGMLFRKDLIEWTDEQIFEKLEGYGVIEVHPYTRLIVLDKVQNFNRIEKTGVFKLVFATNVVPSEVKIRMMTSKVDLYKPMYFQSCGHASGEVESMKSNN